MKYRVISILAAVLLCSVNANAHHSYAAEFDPEHPATIEGVVTEVWFKNPHIRYYIKVTGEDGVAVGRH